MQGRYNTFGQRFGAGLIDGLVFLPLSFIDGFVMRESTPLPLVGLYFLLSYSVFYIYSVIMHAKYGQTLGKMVTKIKVLSSDETEHPGFKRALRRDSPWILFSLLTVVWFLFDLFTKGFNHAYYHSKSFYYITWLPVGWLLIEMLTMVTNKRRRALHDFIGDTVVVKQPYIREEAQTNYAASSSSIRSAIVER